MSISATQERTYSVARPGLRLPVLLAPGTRGHRMSAFPHSAAHPSRNAVAEISGNRDFLPLKGTDHVEFYVGNARQAAYFYRAAFGMSLVAYAGPETGQRDRASYVVQQGKIRFVFTTPLRSDHSIADHILRHGDGVRVIALWVEDARDAWHETTSRGAVSVAEPHVVSDENGTAVVSSIRAYGDTIHTFVERERLQRTVSSRFPRCRKRPGGPACRPRAHRSYGW